MGCTKNSPWVYMEKSQNQAVLLSYLFRLLKIHILRPSHRPIESERLTTGYMNLYLSLSLVSLVTSQPSTRIMNLIAKNSSIKLRLDQISSFLTKLVFRGPWW